MRKTLRNSLILVVSLFCSVTFATNTHNFASGITMEVQLPPNQPQLFTNPVMWRVNGVCEVVSESNSNPIFFRMKKSHGILDNVDFYEGDTLYLTVDNGQKFNLGADARAKIEITNLGDVFMTLRCSNS